MLSSGLKRFKNMRNYKKKKKKFIVYVSEFHFPNLFILISVILISIFQDCNDNFY